MSEEVHLTDASESLKVQSQAHLVVRIDVTPEAKEIIPKLTDNYNRIAELLEANGELLSQLFEHALRVS